MLPLLPAPSSQVLHQVPPLHLLPALLLLQLSPLLLHFNACCLLL